LAPHFLIKYFQPKSEQKGKINLPFPQSQKHNPYLKHHIKSSFTKGFQAQTKKTQGTQNKMSNIFHLFFSLSTSIKTGHFPH